MTCFRDWCKKKYAQAEDSLAVDEYGILMKVIEKGTDTDCYKTLTDKVWKEWYGNYGDQRRAQTALDKLYLRYVNKMGL